MKASRLLLLCAIYLLFGIHAHADIGAVVTCDPANSLTFQTVGANSTTILLKIKRGDSTFDWALDLQHFHVGIEVYDIEYVNPDLIWIISRLGRIAHGATLLNIPLRQVVKFYVGDAFAFSPDMKSIAYIVNCTGRDGTVSTSALFVDDVLVFPEIVKAPYRDLFPTDEFMDVEYKKAIALGLMPVDRFFWGDGKLIYTLRSPRGTFETRSVDIPKPSGDIKRDILPLGEQSARLRGMVGRIGASMPDAASLRQWLDQIGYNRDAIKGEEDDELQRLDSLPASPPPPGKAP